MSRMITAVLIFLSTAVLYAQRPDRDNALEKSGPVPVPADISDRSFNTLDINKLGQYVSNIGQFYSSWNELSPTCEWPLGSAHEQMYRMNVYIGVPGNVVQTRTYGTKEWDPVGGYNNPAKGLLAITTDPETWPLDDGNQPYWPGADPDGNPGIISHQESFGVYSDLTNYLGAADPDKILNIYVQQTSYAWNTSLDEDYIIFKFEVINKDDEPRDSLYFSMYCDFDAGGFESNNEFGDDRLGLELDRQFFYFYDADDYSDQWQGPPFHIGLVFLQTPQTTDLQSGITDWHYTDNWHEPRNITDDIPQYRYMSSDPRLKSDPAWPDLFHGSDLNFDDPSLIRATGDTLVVFSGCGPYDLASGDTLRFIIAMVAGENYDDISANVDRIWDVYNNGYRIKSVPQPVVSAESKNSQAVLTWDNSIDREYLDPLTGTNSLRAYYIYKTEDPNRLTWTLYDSLPRQYWPENAYLPEAYTYSDNAVLNGFYYSYSVTAIDSSGDESGIAALAAETNTVEIRPYSDAQQTADRVRVVPNPYVISAQWEKERLGNIPNGEPIRELSFINLPGNCTISIFTLDGDLVKTIRHSSGTGTAYWDIRSDYNQMVATGVYFYHVSSPQGESVGKFAIIR